jgi:uncharacterized protein YoaH (UPF0181 family)
MSNTATPAQIDQAIADLMKTGMTGESFQVILNSLRASRAQAERKMK